MPWYSAWGCHAAPAHTDRAHRPFLAGPPLPGDESLVCAALQRPRTCIAAATRDCGLAGVMCIQDRRKFIEGEAVWSPRCSDAASRLRGLGCAARARHALPASSSSSYPLPPRPGGVRAPAAVCPAADPPLTRRRVTAATHCPGRARQYRDSSDTFRAAYFGHV
jgi:hypothetical protein